MDDEDDFAFYGEPLKQLDEDNFHKQKAPRIEDQIVTDEKGRRRFHGAFTGGFSAGYFNSVGTKEGWTPSSFVSSRSKKAERVEEQMAVDFMDDEDMQMHGIAPKIVQTKDEFRTSEHKRKRVEEAEGPIPGEPVLANLLKPIRETIGMQMLKKFGWKPGQGIGPRITHREKLTEQNRKIYGCQLPPANADDLDCTFINEETTYAPSDQSFDFPDHKTNVYGVGYKPLSRMESSLEGSSLTLTEKSKKISIKGQAFGIGAFEDGDEDIYERDDMSKYDFYLGPETQNKSKQRQTNCLPLCDALEGFKISSKPFINKEYKLPIFPKNYIPRHIPFNRRLNLNEHIIYGLGRHQLNAVDRGNILSSEQTHMAPGHAPSKLEDEDITEELIISGTSQKCDFQPYKRDSSKQKRYELFCRMVDKGMKDKYHLSLPKSMTDWEKEREVFEFNRASQLFKPLTGSMASRFTKGSQEIAKEEPDAKTSAAKAKIFGKLTQATVDWYPASVVCKRFFVKNPYNGSTLVGVPGTKHDNISIFNVLQDQNNSSQQKLPNPFIENLPSSSNVSIEEKQSSNEITHVETEQLDIVGINVPIEGPPTTDLFKAIFQDSDDSEDEESTDGTNNSDMKMNNSITANEDKHELEPSSIVMPLVLHFRKQSDNSNLNLKDPESDNSNFNLKHPESDYSKLNPKHQEPNFSNLNQKCTESDYSNLNPIHPESSLHVNSSISSYISKIRESTSELNSDSVSNKLSSETESDLKKHKSIFSNIDFDALNQYKSTSFTLPKESNSSSSDDQYGPMPPKNNEIIGNAGKELIVLNSDDSGDIWVEKKSKKSKHKRKKHKKEKRKKHKR